MTRLGCSFLCVVFICVVSVQPVYSKPTTIKPVISIEQEYNDNILFSENDEEKDFITTFSAGVAIEQKTERLNAEVNARFEKLLYWDFDELNSLDRFFNGNVNYRVTEKLGLGASAKYSKDSRRDRDTDTTGLLVSGDRTTSRFSLSSDYLFSEITRGQVTIGYGNVEIDEVSDDEENDDFRIDVTLFKNVSKTFKNTTGLLNFSYLHYTSDIETKTRSGPFTTIYYQDNTSDVFQISSGFSKDITELYNIYFQAGVSYTETTEELRTKIFLTDMGDVLGDSEDPDEDDSNWGGVMSTGLNYDGEYYDIGLGISHDIRGSTGTNGVVQRSMITSNVRRKVTDQLSLTLDANIFLNTNDRKTRPDTEELTVNIQPGFRYRILKDFTLSCYYRFTSVEDRKDNTTSERNMVYFLIRKEFEL